MKQYERHELFLKTLAKHPMLSIEKAMKISGASHATIRRDFDYMGLNKLATRVRGGVQRFDNPGMLPYELRETQHAAEKEKIASKAAELLEPGFVIMVDGGSTTYHLASQLPPFPLRIITNSIRLATELDLLRLRNPAEHPGLEVFLTGGQVYPDSGGLLVGRGAENTLKQYHANLALLSVDGIEKNGFFNTNEAVVDIERTMIEQADKAIVLADHSKLGRSSMCHVCKLDDIDQLISDRHVSSKECVKLLSGKGLEIQEVQV